jgi:hypothetical protein
MFLNSWSLVLSLCSILVLILTALAGNTALKVLRFWNPESDSNRQIRLESETWLAATLVGYGLGFQIISLVLFVLAADHYCQVIAGAMCATGALTANVYGIPALLVKTVGIFFYGFWIVLHQLDIRSESYPLVKLKFCYLLILLPMLAGDILLQTLYIAGLEPDIITSCCAVVFSAASDGRKLLPDFSPDNLPRLFYGSAVFLTFTGLLLLRRPRKSLVWLYAGSWALFFPLALLAVIMVFSAYIYAMPSHNCPFCIFKPEYGYIGFGLFASLLAGAFFGILGAAVDSFKGRQGLAAIVPAFQRTALQASLLLLAVFVMLSSYHYLMYRILGGEN